MMAFSKGDCFGDKRLFFFLRPSDFPTIEIHRFASRIYNGGFCLPKLIGSCCFPNFSGDNRHLKPPSIFIYTLSDQWISLLLSLIYLSVLNTTKTMSGFLRKAVQDLDFGIDDDPIALSPDFDSEAAVVILYSLIVTTVNPRKQNLRALIGQMPRVWGFCRLLCWSDYWSWESSI